MRERVREREREKLILQSEREREIERMHEETGLFSSHHARERKRARRAMHEGNKLHLLVL